MKAFIALVVMILCIVGGLYLAGVAVAAAVLLALGFALAVLLVCGEIATLQKIIVSK